MTKTLAADSNNDLYLNRQGNIATATGIQAVLESCSHAAKALRGEMLLAVNDGMPNFQTIWIGAPNIPQWEAALRQALLAVDGVNQIKALTSKVANNVLSYAVTIETIYGEGLING